MAKEEETRSIVQIKAGLSVRNWEAQIRACQESGKTVKEWCRDNGIPVGTYYARLRKVREAAIAEEQRLFPLASEQSAGIRIKAGGIDISLSEGASPEQLAAVIGALKSC